MTARSRVLALALAVLIAALAPTKADDIDLWKKSNLQAPILGPTRLNLGFADQSGTPRVALVTSLQPAQLDGLPEGLIKAKDSPLLRTGYFESLWTAMRDSVCQDVHDYVQHNLDRSPNTAYDITCYPAKKGVLLATFETSWENDQFQQVQGRRILLNYMVPLNGVTFWMTSPHTCHRGDNCPTEPNDPAFTVIFTVNMFFLCSPTPNAAINTFSLPISCTAKSDIDVEDIIGGDVTGELKAAADKFAVQTLVEAGSVVASGGASLPEAAAGFITGAIKVSVKGLGTLIAGLDDQHLRDSVSLWLAGLGSPTLKANADTVGVQINALFDDLWHAQLEGLKPFVIGIGQGLSLDFGLIYPPPKKPEIKNTVAASNAGSIISPTIAVSQPEVMAGQMLPVTASNFRGTFVNTINVAWTKTVIGKPKSTLEWGPPTVSITTPALTFDATNLKPATAYGFRVHECDGITCAPWSDVLASKTEPAGAGLVTFWLDADAAHPVGTSAAPASGGNFVANVKIPPATAPGQHVLHAGMYGHPPANATITVCQPGGCAPTVSVVNTANGTLYAPGENVVVSSPVVVRGSNFAPNGAVVVFIDTVKGPRAGNAHVGPFGNFLANFTMPMVGPGPHKFLAVEAKPGTAPPHLQFEQASVGVYVQAQAQ